MAKDTQQILEELKSNPRVATYLAQFEENSAATFLNSYASTKQLLLQYGENWRRLQGGTYYRTCAEKYYWIIAQKKLFNLQCLWRAGQITLPVTVTWEFSYWSRNIKSCPFIEDVTEEEIEVMIKYLEKAHYDHDEFEPWDWQTYDEFKDEETGIGASDQYPPWYEMYDNYFGTQHLMTLPDIMGEREERYLAAWRSTSTETSTYVPPTKPYLFGTRENTENFIRHVEDYKILDYYRLHNSFSDKSEFLERVRSEMALFMEEEGEVWIPEGKFPDAIFHAGHLLKVSHLKSLVPEIHQNHLERKEMGITYEQDIALSDDHLIKNITQCMVEGRRILGESED
jgi:hypothetical protein